MARRLLKVSRLATLERGLVLVVVLYAVGVGAAFLLTDAPAGDPPLARGPAGNVMTLTYDDGFYYLRIAEHIARGDGPTFDGLHPTNGYHPLWLLCLVPIFWVTSNPQAALVIDALLQVALLAAAAGLTYGVARSRLGGAASVLAALLWIQSQLTYGTALSGMEYGLHALGVVASAAYYLRWFTAAEPPRLHRHLVLGLLLALTFLARLDSILFALCVFLALGLHGPKAGAGLADTRRLLALRLLAVGAPVAAAALVYAAVNLRLFGHAVPVSGALKRVWSLHILGEDPQYRAHGWWHAKLEYLSWLADHMRPPFVLALAIGSVGTGALWLAALLARGTGYRAVRTWSPLVLFSVGQTAVLVSLYHGGFSLEPWYFVMQPWLAALFLSAVADYLRKRWTPRAALALPVVACLVVSLASARAIGQWRRTARNTFAGEPLFVAARWVRDNVSPGERVGSWNAGLISYVSQRTVVNLDGLVNSWDFLLTGRQNLCRYWQQTGLRYLVDVFPTDHEVAFLRNHQTVWADVTACAPRLRRAWLGPGYPGSSEHPEALELLP